MIAVNGGKRVSSRRALCLALLLSHCIQFILLIGLNPPTRALAATKQSESTTRRPESRAENDDRSFSRPSRVDQQQDSKRDQTPKGPIIRVALMTDVSSLSVSSPSSIILRHSVAGRLQSKNISTGQLTIELRKYRGEPTPVESTTTTYRISVGSSSDSRDAQKLLDELRKRFFDPASITFNENEKEYTVVIGEFTDRNEASIFLERMRKFGYQSLRLVTESKTTDASSYSAIVDTNARAAKYKVQDGSTSSRRSAANYADQSQELIALNTNKITASSTEEFILTPGEANISSDQTDSLTFDADANQTPAHIVVGSKKYRGEIHLILNPRGRINVVNALPLEEYLRGVVPLELSPGAYPELEALKAQAVAARSYALAHLGHHEDEGFDLVDDTRDQVYGGLSAERAMTNRAIAETAGIAAVVKDDRGVPTPIEALYTANCGGRTENNEEVFGGKPVSYLRGVSCASDRRRFDGSDIVTNRTRELLTGFAGHAINREIALLSVSGFSLPALVTNNYLNHPPDVDELKSWLEQIARLKAQSAPLSAQQNVTRLSEFIPLLALSIYGKGRASTLLAPADVDYLLSGFQVVQLPAGNRADAALLLKDGILSASADGVIDGRSQISRGHALECIARAIWKSYTGGNPSLQTSESKPKPNVNSTNPGFRSDTSVSSPNGRLILASSTPVRDSARNSRFTTLNTSSTSRLGASEKVNSPIKSDRSPKKEATMEDRAGGLREFNKDEGLELSDGAWLFRSVAGESQQVERLMLIGGERITYHLNAKGQVDFLEASISDRSASSDRFSSVAQWQERISVDELQQRLERARIKVGRIERIEPVNFSSSSRVSEVELSGSEGSYRLRRPNIRSVLGLKEYLFVVDREVDPNGRVIGFVFTGRGWGHGVGMCQIGAYGLAKDGYTYSEILQKYYTGIQLQKRY
jgi:peptidoglycan hydrolase-like amidase